ncbi:MAG: group 1 truncated hemoglobin [Acidocella sp.]|nr:group 1 truncated hemoglobin [Acidocella sp.]
MKIRNINLSLNAAIGMLCLGVTSLTPVLARADATYYNEFGGRAGIHAVVTDMLTNVLADDRIKSYFTNANIPVLNASLTNQVCMLEGGPCKFDENMKKIHESLGITQAAFNALAEDLQKSMNQHNIPLAAQNDLLSKLAPMEPAIVTK